MSLTVITGEEVVASLSKGFYDKFNKLVETGKIKSDGALDEIPNRKKKTITNLRHFRFIVEVQRVNNVNENNILKNLTDIGGFAHKSCSPCDVFEYEDPEIKEVTSPDGLHRWIMAYLCGVPELAVNPQDMHPIDATEEEIRSAEKQFFDDKNGRSAKITETDQMRSDKLSGKMTPRQRKLDTALKEVGVNVGDIGCPEDEATFVFETVSELDKLVVVKNHPCEVQSTESLAKTTQWLSTILNNKGLSPRLYGAIAKCKEMIDDLDNVVVSKAFDMWMTSDSKGSFRYYHVNWWTALVQHTRNMENTIIRLMVAFNEWYRIRFDEDAFGASMVSDFLDVMNTETNQFVDDCLVKGIPINYHPVSKVMEEEDFSALEEALEI